MARLILTEAGAISLLDLAEQRIAGLDTGEVRRIARAIVVQNATEGITGETIAVAEAIQYVATGGLDAYADAVPNDEPHTYAIHRADVVRTTLKNLEGYWYAGALGHFVSVPES